MVVLTINKKKKKKDFIIIMIMKVYFIWFGRKQVYIERFILMIRLLTSNRVLHF